MTSENIFSPGDLVFAKIKGYPHWPATIKEVILNETREAEKYFIEFFGDKTTAKITGKELFSYVQNKTKYGVYKTENFKNRKFNLALKEAEKALINNGKGSPTTNPYNYINYTFNQKIESEIELEPELKEKILNIEKEDSDLETSLTLAAEVGNALLSENHKLKQDLLEATLKNSKLSLDIDELKNNLQINYQSQLKEMENEREIILDKYNNLVEKLNYAENQLIKEKQIQIQLRKIFEEQDKEKEDTICKLLNEIKELKQYKPTDNLKCKMFKNTETQTGNDETIGNSANGLILTEIVYLKKKQDHADKIIREMQIQLQLLSSPTSHDGLNNFAKQEHLTNKEFLETNRAILKKPNHVDLPTGADQACNITPQARKTNIKAPVTSGNGQGEGRTKIYPNKQLLNSNRKNISSISLQVAKYKEKTQPPEKHTSTRQTWDKKLPAYAMIRPNSENLEEFYNKHIDFYKQISKEYLNKPRTQFCTSPNTVLNLEESKNNFLELATLKKGRHKLH